MCWIYACYFSNFSKSAEYFRCRYHDMLRFTNVWLLKLKTLKAIEKIENLVSIKYSLFIQSVRSTKGLFKKVSICVELYSLVWETEMENNFLFSRSVLGWFIPPFCRTCCMSRNQWFDCCIYFHFWNMGILVLVHSLGMFGRWSIEFLKKSYYPGEGYRGIKILQEWHILLVY